MMPIMDMIYVDNYNPWVAWFHGHLSSNGFALFSLKLCIKVSWLHEMYGYHGLYMVVWISAE